MSILKKKKKFESKLLFIDQDWIYNRIRDTTEVAELSNKAISLVEEFLDRDLNDSEKETAIRKKWDYVMFLLKKDNNLPKATDESIIGLVGKDNSDTVPVKNALTKVRLYINDITLINGQFTVTDETKKEIENLGTYYTKNEFQNNALEAFTMMADALNMAIDNKVILNGGSEEWSYKLEPILVRGGTKNGNTGVKPNYNYILEVGKRRG